ncbi:hypothetical protein ABZ741_39255 [Streptomyces globisporus]|uniref:hypothetical protein n=1 Tax=Streptomyces globisporus TaxID=1908 RepID=UPI00345F834E|nr:hypothetical protein OG838_09595 [Streptomyces globisporus]WSV89506.1 hypothetical protein OG449_09170 [Streptomyces globisporus]
MANLRDDCRTVGSLDAFEADANGSKERQAEHNDDKDDSQEGSGKGIRRDSKELKERHSGPFTFAAEALKRAHSVAVEMTASLPSA